MHPSQAHAEIKVMQRPIPQDAILISLLVLDLFDLRSGPRVKRNQPVIAPYEPICFILALKPFVAEQQANGFALRGTDAIKNQPRV